MESIIVVAVVILGPLLIISVTDLISEWIAKGKAMIRLNVRLACDDCGEVIENETWSCAGDARTDVAERGWSLVNIHRVSLDFCPDCQQPAQQQVVARVVSK